MMGAGSRDETMGQGQNNNESTGVLQNPDSFFPLKNGICIYVGKVHRRENLSRYSNVNFG